MNNHMYDIAFNVRTSEDDPGMVPWADLRAALINRIDYLDRNPSERDGVGYCDSYKEYQ